MKKVCRICGQEFDTIKYGGARQYCFVCVPYTEDVGLRTTYKRNAFKKEGIRLLGGKCMRCGDTRPYVLNFHHLDPKQKNDAPASLLGDSKFEKFIEEIDQCILLCSNCHQEFHYLESHNNIKIDEYVDLSVDYKIKSDINRQQTFVKYYCCDCGKEIHSSTAVRCVDCTHKNNRLVDRPEKDVLAQMIAEKGFEAVGREYGVSGNAVKKWCVTYGLPKLKKDIIEYVKNLNNPC